MPDSRLSNETYSRELVTPLDPVAGVFTLTPYQQEGQNGRQRHQWSVTGVYQ